MKPKTFFWVFFLLGGLMMLGGVPLSAQLHEPILVLIFLVIGFAFMLLGMIGLAEKEEHDNRKAQSRNAEKAREWRKQWLYPYGEDKDDDVRGR